jgi:histidinol-phosphate aminotransferase
MQKRSAHEMIRQEVRELCSSAEVSDRGLPARLLANESSLNPTWLLMEALQQAEALEPNRYWLPEVSTGLLRALSEYCGLPENQILLGNGADELIQATLLAFLRPGDSVILPWPSYPMYPYLARVLGMNPLQVPLREDWSLPVQRIAQLAAESKAPLIILANPNNPTGNLWPQEDLLWLLRHTGCILVVDEAYYEFCGQTAAGLLQQQDRLIIWRTFSKAFSLAGMRIGYLLAQPQLVFELNKVKLPFNISNLSQWMAEAALKHRAIFAEQVQRTVSERERVLSALQQLPGIEVFPSVTNFLLFRTGASPDELHARLYQRGVSLRQVAALSPLLSGCLRASIGAPEENDLFLEQLKQCLE